MFCSNCGKKLDENAKFCDGCGAQQGAGNDMSSASNQQEPNSNPNVNTNYQTSPTASNPQAKKVPKKTTNIIVAAAIVLVAFLIGKFAIAPSMVDDNGGSVSSGNSNNSSIYSSSNDTTNSEYDEILAKAHIVHFPNIFSVGTSTASFVCEAYTDYGSEIGCVDIGYKDDTVIYIVMTLYTPVAECTDSQKAQLESDAKTDLAEYDALNFCNVEYNMGTNYFTTAVTFSDLDVPENWSAVWDGYYINSMSALEADLIAEEGFVKK